MYDASEGFNWSVSIDRRAITNLRFTDNIDLLAGTIHEWTKLTEISDHAATAYWMEISTGKSKVMTMNIHDHEHSRSTARY